MNTTLLFTKRLALTAVLLLLTISGFAQQQTYNGGAGSFTVPAGVTSVTLAAWGGGGGGGGSTINGAGGNGGGGGGATTRVFTVASGNVINYSVGTGGAGGVGNNNGANGGNTTITATTPAINMTANRGNGGLANSGSMLLNTSSDGGTASGGLTNSTGQDGAQGGGTGGNGGNSGNELSIFGTGGTGVANGNGNPGGNPGAGGGGGERTGSSSNGGAGANGQVIIRYITVTSVTNQVCHGGSITITGSGFATTGTTDVTINGTAATSVTVVNATTITAVIPNTTPTGVGTVIINNPNGTNNGRTTTVNANPTVNAGGALTAICNNASTGALGGSSANATSAIWSSNVGGTFTNNGGATPATTTWTPPAGFVGTAVLTLTATSSSCGTVAASKNQVVNGPIANAGAVLAGICQGGTTAALGGSFSGTATGAVWSDGGIGGTFANNGGSTPGTATWTPPAGYSGNATLTLTTIGGACGTTFVTKTQMVAATPVATVGATQTLYGTLVSDPLGANTPAIGTGTWSVVNSPGSATVTFSNANDPDATATVSVNGAYVFRWTINSICGNSSSDISVSFLAVNDPTNTIYYENFDNAPGGWTSGGTTGSWSHTNTAGSPHRGEGGFWAVNTTAGTYPNNALTTLTSPVISTLGFNNVKLFLDLRYLTQVAADGLQVQYSTNGGGSWTVLGTATSGWYTKSNISSLSTSLGSQLGWDGDSSLIGGAPAPSPFSQFIEKNIQSNLLNNLSSLQIRVVFTSNGSATADTGVALDNVIIKGNPIAAIPDPIMGPGSVNANLKLWLKANSGTSTVADGSSVATWSDQAYDNHSVGITGNSPIFRNNATRNINFNPVIDFSAAASHVMKGKGGWWSQEYYVVVKTNGTINNSAAARQVPISGRLAPNSFHLDGTALGLGNFTQRYDDEVVSHNLNSVQATPATATQSYGRAYTSTTDSYNQQTIIFTVKTNSLGTATEIYKNGKRIDNTTGQAVGPSPTFIFQGELNFSNFNNVQYNLGVGRFTLAGNAASSFLDGRMTEIVSYSQQKSTLEQQKIQSYLGIKNGITLHATGSTTADNLGDVNYIDSAGNTIWNVASNAGYNYDIAGIGRDDATILNQKQSKTENTISDISIGLGNLFDVNSNNPNSFDSDRKFLMWGNNQGTLAAQPPITVNLSSGIVPAIAGGTNVEFVAVGRTWKVVETGGNIPSVKVSIPSVMLTATITPPGDFLMFISDSPVFSPTAEYRTMVVNGANLEANYDFNGVKYITFGYAPERTFVRSVDFDGVDDYMDAGNVLNLPTNFTVSAWVKKASNNKTILSKRNAGLTEGYDLSINSAGRAEMSWFNGSTRTLTSSVTLPNNIWHHVAVIYNGTTAIMYIDGVADTSLTAPGVITNTQSFLIGAANGASPSRFFDGNIDEVRVWSTALTVNQLRYSMNQEILRNGTLTNGVIIPNNITLNEISAIPWSSLSAYYPMSTYTYTNAKDISNNNFTAAIKNLNTVDNQTAPLPYESAANGNWETATTWTNNTVQDRPNSPSLVNPATTVNWNIVRTSHNINSVGNKTVLGLFVNSGTLKATTTGDVQTDGTKIEVTNYLRLDGKIDLVGRSQLVQKTDSDLDILSSGSIERDQQGQANLYNYNYWGSPVGTINTTNNNTNYTVATVLQDGTNPALPAAFQWTSSLFADNTTTPRTLSRYWINKFDNVSNAYANWSRIGETAPLRAGQGFTLKGTGAATTTQNLVFVGKPNNGTITNTVGKEQLLLVGNPYPSALDAVKFIQDNTSATNDVITGDLYFWEHYTTNNTHFLKDYQGGYGVRNLTGGTAPSSTDLTTISGFGTTSKSEPRQFIPVGQGFFVVGNDSGASTSLQFNNSQREFVKEDAVDGSSNPLSQTMYRTTSKEKTKDHWTDNSNAAVPINNHKKIHIGFNLLSNNFHRQVLLGFMDEKANNEINRGYDALNIDGAPSDMYLLNKDKMLIIQGEGYFEKEASFPIAVKMAEEGKVSFVIDKLENFDADQNYFIYDAQTDTYNSIKKGAYETVVAKGETKNRFALHFTDKKAVTVVEQPTSATKGIEAVFTRYNNTLNITNGVKDATIEVINLYNTEGALIKTWELKDKTQFYYKLPITENSATIYIVKIKTSKGLITQKIIVK